MESNCRLAGCSQATDAHNASCPSCLKVPDSDLYSTYTSHKYCCTEHLLQDKDSHEDLCKERQVHRTIVRAGAMANKVFAAWSRTMSPFNILQENIISNTRREFVVEYTVDNPTALPYSSVSQVGNKAVMSFENCTSALILLAPLFSWSLQDLAVRLHEVNLVPKKACDVRMSLRRFGAHWPMEPARIHTILQIRPKDSLDGVVVDVSSSQYLLPVHTHLRSTYQREHTRTEHWSENPFGVLFERHEMKMESLPPFNFEVTMQNEASIRAINNVVLAEVNKLGGRQRFFAMSHIEFCQAIMVLERKMEEALRRLRYRVDWALSHNNYWTRLDRFQKVVAEMDGPGHRNMVSLFRMNTRGG